MHQKWQNLLYFGTPPHPLKILEWKKKIAKLFLSVLQILQIFDRFIANFLQISKIALETLQIRSFPFGVYKYYIPLNGRFADLLDAVPECADDYVEVCGENLWNLPNLRN